jgi:hypothetical protein
MSEGPSRRRLTEAERQEVRRILRRRDGGWLRNALLRIGRPQPAAHADIDWAKHLFGQSLILVGIFVLVLFFVLPVDDRRWVFIGMALLTVAVGAHQVDAARKSGKK